MLQEEKIEEKIVSIRRVKVKTDNEAIKHLHNESTRRMGSEGFAGTSLPVTGLTAKEKVYIMPELVQVGATHNEFDIHVNNYFHELEEPVPVKITGLKLNISTYKTKVHIPGFTETGQMEKVDMPVNKRDYVLWKRAIHPKYRQVAKDISELDASTTAIFYIHDENKARELERELGTERDKAFNAYLMVKDKKEKWDDIFIVYGINPDSIAKLDKQDRLRALAEVKNDATREEKLEAYRKFYQLVDDAELEDKSFLRKLLGNKSVLISGTTYMYDNGAATVPMGNSEKAAIAWLNDPANSKERLVLEAKLDTE